MSGEIVCVLFEGTCREKSIKNKRQLIINQGNYSRNWPPTKLTMANYIGKDKTRESETESDLSN